VFRGILSVLLAIVTSQTPDTAPPNTGRLPELKAGTQVRITTSRDTITGTVDEGVAGEFLRLRIDGATTSAYVRRSAIETIRILLAPPAPRARAALAVVNPSRHLVYVHGICKHVAGFSKPWWDAMKAYTTQISPANVHEVVWSDIVNPAMAAAPAAPPPQALNDEQRRLAETLRAILRDRAEQAEAEGGASPVSPSAAPNQTSPEMMAPASLFGGITESIECADDFVLYMTASPIREQVLDRFDRVVHPLLEGGAEVEIISHSWGTVIAYEGLRRLDAQNSGTLRGTVRNLFTVGSALSISPVRLNLAARFPGGQKPQRVSRWVNIDARFDVVGGHIQNAPFAVDVEQLHLAPVGCTFPVMPTCAHGSYFDARNLQVNRDIFGLYIGQ
jgi:hypothetical protein